MTIKKSARNVHNLTSVMLLKGISRIEKHEIMNLTDTAVFFQLFNFKMKIFQILGHLQYISDQEFEKFSS